MKRVAFSLICVILVTTYIFSQPISQEYDNNKKNPKNEKVLEGSPASPSQDPITKALKEKQDENESLKKEVEDLKKEIKSLCSDTTSLKGRVAGLEKQIKGLEKQLKEEKSSNSRDKINKLTKQNDSLKKANDKKDVEIANINKSREDDSIKIGKLRAEIENLSDIKTIYFEQLKANVVPRWLDKPYSQLDIKELSKECEIYSKYAEEDNEIKQASEKLLWLKTNLDEYNKFVEILNSQYNKMVVDEAISLIKSLKTRETNQQRIEEIETVREMLDDYQGLVECFKSLIEVVNEDAEGASGNALKISVTTTLNKEEVSINRIKENPWLAQQFENYKEEILKETKSTKKLIKPTENLIMSLSTE